MKNLIAGILLVAMMLTCTVTAFAVQATSMQNTSPEGRVTAFFDSINNKSWDSLSDMYCSSAKSIYDRFNGNPANHENNAGILAISSAEIVNMTPADKDSIPYFSEIDTYYSMPEAICCYYADVELSVEDGDGYFCDGVNNFVVALVKENDEWLIGAVGAGPAMRNTRQGYGLITLTAEPTEITVMDQNGNISTVAFDDVVFNATCNEIGNMGYNANAIKANVMAVKMFAWWAHAGQYRAAVGCDIMFGDIAYMSINNAGTTGQTAIQNAMNALDNYYMVSSSATGGKLFSSTYVAGYYSYDHTHASSGKLRQNESNYLAVEMDYDWEDILHFYYDNSTYNYPNVGTVQIIGCNHTYGAYQHDGSTHWKVCSNCGESTAHESHNWVTFGRFMRCTVCNYIYYIGGGVMRSVRPNSERYYEVGYLEN